MKILAIDPGNVQSAWVWWDTETNDFVKSKLQCGIRENFKMLPICRHAGSFDLSLLAIEMVQNYGMGVGRTIFETVLWVGRFMEASGIPVKLYGRPTIKGHLQARTDAEVRASLRIRHGDAKKGEKLEGVKKDIWSALALATALTENPNLREW